MIKSIHLTLNGQDRMAERSASYFEKTCHLSCAAPRPAQAFFFNPSLYAPRTSTNLQLAARRFTQGVYHLPTLAATKVVNACSGPAGTVPTIYPEFPRLETLWKRAETMVAWETP